MIARSRLKALLGCLATAGAMAAVPAAASATKYVEVDKPGVALGFELRGAHGYRLSFESVFAHQVTVIATKGDLIAQYFVPGHADRHGFSASLGKLGRLSVRFHGTPRHSSLHYGEEGCEGRPAIHEIGTFEGTIRFRGELGFTSVSTSSAEGFVERRFRRLCPVEPGAGSGPGAAAAAASGSDLRSALTVVEKGANREVVLETSTQDLAEEEPPALDTYIDAILRERLGRIKVERSALIDSSGGVLSSSPAGVEPVTATATLPSPFSGTATYTQGSGADATWTGDLSVVLPGAGLVALAGPSFKALLCEGAFGPKYKRCVIEAGKLAKPSIRT